MGCCNRLLSSLCGLNCRVPCLQWGHGVNSFVDLQFSRRQLLENFF